MFLVHSFEFCEHFCFGFIQTDNCTLDISWREMAHTEVEQDLMWLQLFIPPESPALHLTLSGWPVAFNKQLILYITSKYVAMSTIYVLYSKR